MNATLELTPDLTGPARSFLMAIRNPATGCLRASKPSPSVGPKFGLDAGEVQYVWRMVAFFISSNPQHHCMPVCADFYLPYADYQQRRQRSKELDLLVDAIVDTVAPANWHGVARWSRALGG